VEYPALRKMNILIASLIVFMLPTHPPDLFSVTGPSSAEIKIVPIGFNNGAVLFKTYHYINRNGAHSFVRTEFGWLVVSADGIWEEAPHIILEPEKKTSSEEYLWKQLSRYQDEFDRDFNWSSPPYSVRRLLKKYGFTSSQRISRNKGKGMVIWTPTRVCKGGKCPRGAIVQRSLRKLRNVRGQGYAIKCSFYYAGVALFKNHAGYDDKKPEGARFFIRSDYGPEVVEVDEFEVDAIAIIK
jgi:hypothetical protein